jgi:hypothetical protein
VIEGLRKKGSKKILKRLIIKGKRKYGELEEERKRTDLPGQRELTDFLLIVCFLYSFGANDRLQPPADFFSCFFAFSFLCIFSFLSLLFLAFLFLNKKVHKLKFYAQHIFPMRPFVFFL